MNVSSRQRNFKSTSCLKPTILCILVASEGYMECYCSEACEGVILYLCNVYCDTNDIKNGNEQ